MFLTRQSLCRGWISQVAGYTHRAMYTVLLMGVAVVGLRGSVLGVAAPSWLWAACAAAVAVFPMLPTDAGTHPAVVAAGAPALCARTRRCRPYAHCALFFGHWLLQVL